MTDLMPDRTTDADAHSGAGAPPRPVGPPPVRRLVLGSAATALSAGVVAAAARSLDEGTAAAVVSVALGLAVVPVVAAVLEWFVHRFVYHQAVVGALRSIFVVHTAHHYAFFPTWRYVTGGPARRLAIRRRGPDIHRSAVRNAGVRLAHFGWYMTIGVVVVWVPAWLATANPWFLAGIVVSSVVVSNLFIVVHDTIHRPGSHRIVEAQPWYAFLDRHHWIHHIDLGANLNFLLPLGDLLFGTLRTTVTDDELAAHGTLAAAKSRPSGTGERARAGT